MWKHVASVVLLSFVIGCQRGGPLSETPAEVSDATLDQAAKLLALVTSVQAEYETLLTQASYPNDETKTRAKQWIKSKQLFYEVLRVRHVECAQQRTRRALLDFVELATGFVDVPEGTFTNWT